MKKNLALVLVLALVMAVAVVAFASCGGQTYEGEYKYENPWNKGNNDYYGVKVKVTVSNNVITKVEITSENKEGYTNLSAGWTEEGKKFWNDNVAAFLQTFEGLTVEDVNKIVVAKDANGAPDTSQGVDTISGAPSSLEIVEKDGHTTHTGATQSSGRVILAVQDALSKIEAAK